MALVGKLTGHTGMMNHGINSMTALFSVCFLLLVRSNAGIWDCTDNPASTARCSDPYYTTEAECDAVCGDATWLPAVGASRTVDEFPDMECSGGTWLAVAAFSGVSLVIYIVIIPTFFLRKLSGAKKDGTLVDPEMKARYGWLFLRE